MDNWFILCKVIHKDFESVEGFLEILQLKQQWKVLNTLCWKIFTYQTLYVK